MKNKYLWFTGVLVLGLIADSGGDHDVDTDRRLVAHQREDAAPLTTLVYSCSTSTSVQYLKP